MTITSSEPSVSALRETLNSRIAGGDRFAGVFAARRNGGITLSAQVAGPDGIDTLDTPLPPGAASYPALTPVIGAAFWYERVIHDETGVIPEGHPGLAPLVAPGRPEDHALPRHVAGYGMFTIPHGPVRSGVFESMEYLVETPGEAIPHLNMRIFYKHRGIAARFTGMTTSDGVLLAERAEGIASVAHALAYCHAAEAIAGCEIPREAALVRVVHAELERIANHLDVAMRLADAAGLAVAAARFALHKERVLRLVSGLCGSRFGRGVVVPGGIAAVSAEGPGRDPRRARPDREAGHRGRRGADGHLLVPRPAARHRPAHPGPRPRARRTRPDRQGVRVRRRRPRRPPLRRLPAARRRACQAALRRGRHDQAPGPVRGGSGGFPPHPAGPHRIFPNDSGRLSAAPCDLPDGRATGWAEAPQGEVIYDLTVEGGRIARCQPRSASFHNLVLMHEVFAGDILTDFPFIEASFGLSVAGAAL